MASAVRLITILVVMVFSQEGMYCEDSAQSTLDTDIDNPDSIPMLPSGKRQHTIMRFGKRPAGGHSLIHFGKREGDPPSKPPTHSFLYFGKRTPADGQTLPDFLKYLQKNRDSSYKRGHAIMRFGKRGGGENHNFIRFGKREDDEDEDDYSPEGDYDGQKRNNGGHSMMYFGKRDGHSMLYFGKRAGGHAILSFGKRDPDEQEKRGAHSMIHFGKREYDDEDDMTEDKRAHAMIHFGKREGDDNDEDDMSKRGGGGSHSMIHFGKRDPSMDDITPLFWFPESSEKRQHNLLRFGKKMDGLRKGSHSMIHFGKREEPKNAHAMIHFGKRSVDPDAVPSTNKSEKPLMKSPPKGLARMKRDIDPSHGPLMSLIQPEDDGIDESNSNIVYYPPEDIFSPFEVPGDQDGYSDGYPAKKSDTSKNVFLRFG